MGILRLDPRTLSAISFWNAQKFSCFSSRANDPVVLKLKRLQTTILEHRAVYMTSEDFIAHVTEINAKRKPATCAESPVACREVVSFGNMNILKKQFCLNFETIVTECDSAFETDLEFSLSQWLAWLSYPTLSNSGYSIHRTYQKGLFKWKQRFKCYTLEISKELRHFWWLLFQKGRGYQASVDSSK